MKVTLALLSVVGLTMAHPGSLDMRAVTAAEAAAQAGTMTFVGQIEVGGPNITLQGDAKSIYEQIRKLNPNYDPNQFPEYRERNRQRKELAAVSVLATRSDKSLSKRDWMNCDYGENVGGNACLEGIDYLYALNGYCGAPAGWGGCARVSCSWGCGMFLCNDNPFPISVWCGNIAGDVIDIFESCGTWFGDPPVVNWASGQVFRDQSPGWNSLLTLQSC